MKLSTEQRLIKYRRITENNCWEWAGGCNPDGYGNIKINGKTVGTHRAAASVWLSIPDGASVLHTCDNRKCFNPEHLFFGTQLTNIRDCIAKGRFKYNGRMRKNKPFCKRGHPLSGENLYTYPDGKRRQCRACGRKEVASTHPIQPS